MTHTDTLQAIPEVSHLPRNDSHARGVSGLIILGALLAVGMGASYLNRPPRPVSGQGSLGQFSAERALKHVFAISRNPHPLGSVEHSIVRDYILSTLAQSGVPAAVQRGTAVSQKAGVAASVENIVGRLQGSGSGKAVLLVAHYDSVSTSFGASDDGAGVATLLETARVLKSLPQPKRDVVFLFTDGEEIGLLGAEAFVADSQAGNYEVVLNFEARGTNGPAILFETSDRNGSLIRTVSRTVQHPVANSLSYEIYKRLPNDTDFTVFKRAGYSGLNCAFIDGLVHYHTATDTYQNLDPSSLQHEGDYAVDLARWFSTAAEGDLKENNVVYFDVLGVFLVRYSSAIATLLVALASLLLAGVVIHGRRKAWLSVKGVSFGLVVMVAMVATGVAGAFVAEWLVGVIAGGSRRVLAGELYNGRMYVAAFSTIGLATAFAVYAWASKRIEVRDLAVSGLAVWFALLLITSIGVSGAAYVWLWPLLFFLIAWNVALNTRIHRGIVLMAAAIASVIFLAPLIQNIFTAFVMGSDLMVTALLILLACLVASQLRPDSMPRWWALPGILYAVGSGLLVTALLFSPQFDSEHPRFDSVFYGADTVTGKQIWASYDDQPDEWTSQFLNPVHKETLAEFFPGSSRKFLEGPSEALNLEAPQLDVLESKEMAGGRQVRVRVSSPRHAPILSLFISGETPVVKASVNGKDIPAARTIQGTWAVQYYGAPAEGIELILEVKGASPFSFQVADISYGLPERALAGARARPGNVIPSQFRLSNSTVVAKTFSL